MADTLPTDPAGARRRFPQGPARRLIADPGTLPGPKGATPGWQRPILRRYTDPLELIWMSTARQLGLALRRDPSIFSMTDGAGLLALGPREDLDPDDTAAQMILHELCHWITNGVDSYDLRDWDFPVGQEEDMREYATQRLQAALADSVGLRHFFGPTGMYREYYDRIPADPFAPLDDSAREAWICREGRRSMEDAAGAPWAPALQQALQATASICAALEPFLAHYQTDIEGDALPSLWAADPPPRP